MNLHRITNASIAAGTTRRPVQAGRFTPVAGTMKRLGRALPWPLLSGILLLVVVAWASLRQARTDPLCVVSGREMTLHVPEWASEEVAEEILDSLRAAGPYSLMQSGSIRRMASALGECPWVRRVAGIRRSAGRGCQLALELRRPAAFVEHRGQRYMVDSEGVRLPEGHFRFPEGEPAPLLKYNQRCEVPGAGRVWDSDGVAAGLMMVGFLKEKRALRGLGVCCVDTSQLGVRHPKAVCVRIYTKQGAEIRWGCSPLCRERPYLCKPANELTDEQKYANLRAVLAEHPGLAGVDYVDVRWMKVGIVNLASAD